METKLIRFQNQKLEMKNPLNLLPFCTHCSQTDLKRFRRVIVFPPL